MCESCLILRKAPHYVWRHTCLSVDFTTGRTVHVEGGRLVKDVTDQLLADMFPTFDSTMNSVTVGCQYRLTSPYYSLYGNMHGRCKS